VPRVAESTLFWLTEVSAPTVPSGHTGERASASKPCGNAWWARRSSSSSSAGGSPLGRAKRLRS
jgi:hypothetical protein